MSVITITVAGIDVTAAVIFSDAEFTAAARGAPGTCRFRIRDDTHEKDFTPGATITLDVDGERVWGGYIATVERGYFWDAYDCRCKTHLVPRYFLLTGYDYNILLQKRVLYDKEAPSNAELTRFPANTNDSVVLKHYITNHTDLLADGVTTSLVETVGSPSLDDAISGAAGWKVNELCQLLAFNTGAIWYLDPDKNFVWTDVDTPTAGKILTDTLTPPPANVLQEDFGAALGPEWTLQTGSGDSFVTGGYIEFPAGSVDFYQYTGTSIPLPTTVTFDFWVPAAPYSDYMSYNVDVAGRSLFAENWPDDGVWYVLGPQISLTQMSAVTFQPDAASWYRAKCYVEAGVGGAIMLKVWKVGTTEPDWQFVGSAAFTHGSYPNGFGIFDDNPNDVMRMDTIRWAEGQENAPGGEIGYREMEIDFDGTRLRNQVIVWGAGQGASNVVVALAEDATSMSTHGVWQHGLFTAGVWRQTTAQRMADSFVYGSPQNKRGGKDDRISVRCSIFQPGIRVAEKVTFISEVFGFEDVIPVRQMRITFPTPTDARFDLVLSHEIDEPWSTFEFWFPDFDWDLPPLPEINIPTPSLPSFDPCSQETGGPCCETFTRLRGLGQGWGLSEFQNGYSWTDDDGNPTEHHTGVDGDKAYMQGEQEIFLPGSPFSALARQRVPVSTQLPFEVHLRFKYESGPIIFNGPDAIDYAKHIVQLQYEESGDFFADLLAINIGETFISPGSGVQQNGLLSLYAYLDGHDSTLGAHLGQGGRAIPGGVDADVVRFKVRIEQKDPTEVYGVDGVPVNMFTKGWLPGVESEPPWTQAFTRDLKYRAPNLLRVGNVIRSNYTLWLDEICVISDAWPCGIADDPCAGDNPPQPDNPCYERYLCENLARIPTPPGKPSNHTYFSTTHQWTPGTDEVWVDGLRIDTRDYAADYYNKYIEIYDHVPVGGGDSFDPPKVVHMCYWTACIAVGEAP